MLIFITTIATQANGNLDNVIIGAVVNARAITVYSMGLLIFSMFEQLSTSISSVMLPTVTETLKNDDDNLSALVEEYNAFAKEIKELKDAVEQLKENDGRIMHSKEEQAK